MEEEKHMLVFITPPAGMAGKRGIVYPTPYVCMQTKQLKNNECIPTKLMIHFWDKLDIIALVRDAVHNVPIHNY